MTIRSNRLRTGLIVGVGLLFGSASAPGFQNTSLPTHGVLSGRAQQTPAENTAPLGNLSEKQKHAILKSNFQKMKQDADQLASLAKSLQEDLDKSNVNVLSLDVIEKAEKIEKLAKRIKSTARGM